MTTGESTATEQANPRSCYCGIRETNPTHFTEQGVPLGFCGICERCGQPGHTRHFPGPVPSTGAWCDRCYQFVGRRFKVLRVAIPALIILAVALLTWVRSRR